MNAAEAATELRGEREALGSRLVHAREARGLSAEQVARSLKLSTSQIRALEAGEYAKLPGNTYVRGYLRSYSRLLGLPEKDVLDAHARATAQPTAASSGAPEPQRPAAKPRELKAGDRPVRLVSYIIAFGLAGLLVAWWQAREDTPPAAPAGAQEQSGTRALERIAAPAPAPTMLPAPAEPAGSPAGGDTTGAVVPFPAGADTVEAPPQVADSNAAAGAAASETGTPAAADTAPGELEVVLRFRAECWADVRDARGERLVYRTVAPGSVLRVHGAPPLRFFFGNAAAVEVEYAGKPYDLAPHIRGVFARFSLPASGAGGSDSR